MTLNNVRKIKEIPFPFAFAQMQVALLMFHLCVTGIMSVYFAARYWAVTVSFLISFSVWLPHFVALELEMPFGEDDSDLPVAKYVNDFNLSLANLIDVHRGRNNVFAGSCCVGWAAVKLLCECCVVRSAVGSYVEWDTGRVYVARQTGSSQQLCEDSLTLIIVRQLLLLIIVRQPSTVQ